MKLTILRRYYLNPLTQSHRMMETQKSHTKLTKDEYIAAIEKKNAQLSRLLAISEFQKDKLKREMKELQDEYKKLIVLRPQ